MSARSFARSCVALIRRTVPLRERMTSDSVVAERARRSVKWITGRVGRRSLPARRAG